jgi:hypothetical protein
MANEIDYRAQLKATLDDFERAAEKGDEAARALYAGVSRLASLTLHALQGTPFEKQADLLAAQLAKAGVTPETLHNAPLKVTRTGGADVYKVVDKLQKAAAETQEKPARAEARQAEEAPAPKEDPKTGRK